MSPTPLVILAVVTPAVAASLIWVFRDWANTRDAISLTFGVALLSMVLTLYPQVADGLRLSSNFGEMLPGLEIAFVVEPLGMLFALVSSSLWIVTTVYSIGYMRYQKDAHQGRFFMFFALSISAAIGIAFAGNLFTLFIAYEALTLATYPLVAHYGTDAARRGARVYLGLLLSTSIGFLLVAIIATWSLAGTLEFIPGGILAGKVEPWAASLLLVLYVFGIGKAAVMPFHRWLPSAMVAPAPVSALLHAVAVVKAGVFTVVKVIVYIFGYEFLANTLTTNWLVYIAGFTILAASIVALRQDNLKRRLAYSTISQLSYVVMATAILAPLSVMGAVLHIAAHAVGKITLFFAAGSIYTAAHKTEVSQLNGIGRKMPWTMAAFAIASLSMIGVPPTAGFLSKWYILLGALEAEHVFAIGVIIISTLLNAGYFMPIVYRAFFKEPDDTNDPHADHGEAPLPVVIALTATALGTILLFFFSGLPLELAHQVIGK